MLENCAIYPLCRVLSHSETSGTSGPASMLRCQGPRAGGGGGAHVDFYSPPPAAGPRGHARARPRTWRPRLIWDRIVGGAGARPFSEMPPTPRPGEGSQEGWLVLDTGSQPLGVPENGGQWVGGRLGGAEGGFRRAQLERSARLRPPLSLGGKPARGRGSSGPRARLGCDFQPPFPGRRFWCLSEAQTVLPFQGVWFSWTAFEPVRRLMWGLPPAPLPCKASHPQPQVLFE